eukprot:4347326-Prymnesium_polylepis.1
MCWRPTSYEACWRPTEGEACWRPTAGEVCWWPTPGAARPGLGRCDRAARRCLGCFAPQSTCCRCTRCSCGRSS